LGEERERGTREAATFVLKVDGGVEQMRGGAGVAPRSKEVGERPGGQHGSRAATS
jgi:hypothetical protein